LAIWWSPAKLALAVYASKVAHQTYSKAVNADARDHVADVFSGLVVIVGIGAARAGLSVLDPLAGLVVSGFILYTAFSVFLGAATELMDTSLTPALRAAVIAEIAQIDGVHITGVAGRMIGSETLVELHADVDPTLSVAQAGALVDAFKARLVAHLPEVEHVVVALNSVPGEPVALLVTLPGYRLTARAPTLWECNWLQVKENSMDPAHLVFLHTLPGSQGFTEDLGALTPDGLVLLGRERGARPHVFRHFDVTGFRLRQIFMRPLCRRAGFALDFLWPTLDLCHGSANRRSRGSKVSARRRECSTR